MPFKKGHDPNRNMGGRPEGSGLSITSEIRKKLMECPKDKRKTYLQYLLESMMHKAIVDKDVTMLTKIWAYMDGMPQQYHDHTSNGDKITSVSVVPVIEEIK